MKTSKHEKTFGLRGIPLDREAKTRIVAYAKAWSARNRGEGQHRGPITRATEEVLAALLWGFHNSKSGLCFPSYEAIAAKARCCRDTVCEAIKALERAGIMTWVNRIVRERVRERDLFGQWATRWRVLRTSNAYVFRDPLPCAERPDSSRSENPPGTMNQDISALKTTRQASANDLESVGAPLLRSLERLGKAIAARDASAMT